MDNETNICEQHNILTVSNFHLNLTWTDEYADDTSLEFQSLAHRFEAKIYQYYVVKKGITDIKGLRITKMTEGSVILDIAMSLRVNASQPEVFEELQKVNQDKLGEAYAAFGLIPQTSIVMADKKAVQVLSPMTISTLIGSVVAVIALMVGAFAVWKCSQKRKNEAGKEKKETNINSKEINEVVANNFIQME